MAKTRKKYNPVKRKQSVHGEYRERFWFCGATCLTHMAIGGVLPGNDGLAQMADSYRLKHRWRGYALAFQTNGSQRWVDSIYCEAPIPMHANDFRGAMDSAQDKLIKEANDKYLTSVAYICTISTCADVEALLKDTISWLQGEGAFDVEWCNMCFALQPA